MEWKTAAISYERWIRMLTLPIATWLLLVSWTSADCVRYTWKWMTKNRVFFAHMKSKVTCVSLKFCEIKPLAIWCNCVHVSMCFHHVVVNWISILGSNINQTKSYSQQLSVFARRSGTWRALLKSFICMYTAWLYYHCYQLWKCDWCRCLQTICLKVTWFKIWSNFIKNSKGSQWIREWKKVYMSSR